MDKLEADKLITELNELSENFPDTKERMVEIAKILLTEHFWSLKKKETGEKVAKKDFTS